MDRTTTPPRTEAGAPLAGIRLPYLVAAATVPLLLLVGLGVILLMRAPSASPTAIGRPAPDFTVADLDGNPIRLADLRGRPVIVNFWASWCGPCVEEFPLLNAAAAAHADAGLAVVGIVFRDRSEAARDFMARNAATWPSAMDPGERVATDYGIVGAPETYFIGRDGSIVARQIGQISATSLNEKLAATIEE